MLSWLPATYVPIGLLGAIRWFVWLFRRSVAMRYRAHDGTWSSPLSVVTPVYQESPETFAQAIGSWLTNPEVVEVICVIDVTDADCLRVAVQFARSDDRVRAIVTDVPGKRDALRRGWEAASSEIVALVDSDTIWAPDVAAEVLRPFGDDSIGAVATRQNVHRPRTIWQRLTDFYLDYRYYDEIAAQTAMGRAISCVSGRTAVYRRSILLEVSDEFMTETFWGVPCNSGDDKCLTRLTLERGHRTYLQRTARVWSTFPPDRPTFARQRLRWARNTWRSDLTALAGGWVVRHPFLAFTMVDKSVSPFTALLAPAFFLIAVIRGDTAIVVIILVWWCVSRGLKNLSHLRQQPRDLLLVPAFILVSFYMNAIRIRALLTIRTQRWLTRDVAVEGGEIIRQRPTAPSKPIEAATT